MKLSSLTITDKIKLAAELDGWTSICDNCGELWGRIPEYRTDGSRHQPLERYSTSRDAIVPVIEKQLTTYQGQLDFHVALQSIVRLDTTKAYDIDFMCMMATPTQLLDDMMDKAADNGSAALCWPNASS